MHCLIMVVKTLLYILLGDVTVPGREVMVYGTVCTLILF